MNTLEITIRETKELSEQQIIEINNLKQQHWKYSEAEHMRWFRENIRQDDKHVLLREDGELAAYLNLVNVKVLVGDKSFSMLGIGNVCVSADREGLGVGAVLMAATNSYLKRKELCGILFCRDKVLDFYARVGWTKTNTKEIKIEGKLCDCNMMLYDPLRIISGDSEAISVDRDF